MTTPAAFAPEPSFAESARTVSYWNDHYQELLVRYPEQFVAVKGDSVVAASPDLAHLVSDLHSLGLDPRTDVAIQLISARSASLIL